MMISRGRIQRQGPLPHKPNFSAPPVSTHKPFDHELQSLVESSTAGPDVGIVHLIPINSGRTPEPKRFFTPAIYAPPLHVPSIALRDLTKRLIPQPGDD